MVNFMGLRVDTKSLNSVCTSTVFSPHAKKQQLPLNFHPLLLILQQLPLKK